MDFIDEYKNMILEGIPTHEDWAEAISITMLSTALGPERYLPTMIGKLKLNVWYLTIAPSGIGFKTAPLKYFAFPTLAKITEILDYPMIMPNRYSLEGFIEYLKKGYTTGCIVRDEFTSMFKESGKQYLTDIMEFLSELYDGAVQKRYTRKSKLEEVKNVYITFIGATTPYLFKIMKADWFMQGTGNRILFIIYERTGRENETIKSDDFFMPQRLMVREQKIEKYAKILAKIHVSNLEIITPNKKAGEELLKFRNEMIKKSEMLYRKDIYDLTHSYYARMPEYAFKLSAIKCASRNVDLILNTKNLDLLMITIDDVKWALERINKHLQYFNKLINMWRIKPEPMTAVTVEEQANFVIEMLDGHKEGLLWKDLRSTTRWSTGTWLEVLKYLWDTDRIVVVRTKGAGTKLLRFFRKDYETFAIQSGDKVYDWETVKVLLGLK